MRDRIDHAFRLHFRRELAFMHRHLIVAFAVLVVGCAVLVLSAYSFGRQTQSRYDAAYFLNHVTLNQPHAPRGAIALVGYVKPPVQNAAGVDVRRLDPVSYQGPLGQCQCYAFRYQYDYLYNSRNHTYKHFSCKLWYAEVGAGFDRGSSLPQYAPILAAVGAIPSGVYDYQGVPTRVVWPVPSWVLTQARAHRYGVSLHYVTTSYGGGQNVISAIERTLSRHVPVNIGLDVYGGPGANGLLDVNSTAGIVDVPIFNTLGVPLCPTWQAGLPFSCLAGYHAVTGIRYNRRMCRSTISGYTCGFVLVLNSWGRNWGINCRTLQPEYGHAGCAWISYRYIQHYVDEVDYLGLTKLLPRGGQVIPWHQAGPNADKPLPPPVAPAVTGGALPPVRSHAGFGGNWVWRVYLRDVGGDWGSVVNDAAHANGISAPGLLSTLFAECGLFSQSPQCDRDQAWPDDSYGWCQVTIATAAGLGVGGGNYGWRNYVRAYEDVVRQCVWLAARYLGGVKRYEASVGCYIDFPQLYVAWNAGPGNPCWFLTGPTGQAGTNYYGNYLQNWNTALGYSTANNPYSSTPIAEPRPVSHPYSSAAWYSYERAHRFKHLTAAYYHKKLSWAATIWLTHRRLKGVVGPGIWYAPDRRRGWSMGFMKYRFQCGDLFAWPSNGAIKVAYHACLR